MTRFVCFLSSAAAIAVASNASAAIVATDSYRIGTNPPAGEYVNATSIRTQPATLVNQGFANGPYASGSGTSNFTATSTGLNSLILDASGGTSGKVNWIGAAIDANVRSNARGLSPAVPTSSTYWMSHVVNLGGITAIDPAGWVLTGFGNATVPAKGTTTGNLAGLFVGFAPNAANNTLADLVIRYRNTVGATSTDAVLVDGGSTNISGSTYTVIMKVDVNASGAEDNVTWFVNPSNGFTEAQLASTALATGTFSGFPIGAASDFVRLNYSASKWNGTAFFDEPRLSTDLAGLSLVPEPASLAALVLGGLALVRRGRSRLS